MAVAEHEIGFYSEFQSIFKSFGCTANVARLPHDVYASIIHYITFPSFRFIATVLASDLSDIEAPLVTVFAHVGSHRLLLHLCVLEDALSCPDSASMMSRCTMHFRVLLEFAERQLAPLQPRIDALKRVVCSGAVDPSGDDLAALHGTVQSFLNALLELATSLPSSVRFVCRCLNETYTFVQRSPAIGRRAVFLFVVSRLLFPMMALRLPTDPPELVVDPRKMEKLADVLPGLFLDDSSIEPRIASACEDLREDIDAFFYFAPKCVDCNDVLERPSFDEATRAVDQIRAACAPVARELAYAPRRAIALFTVWLNTLVDGE
jgi:hypothetical protein